MTNLYEKESDKKRKNKVHMLIAAFLAVAVPTGVVLGLATMLEDNKSENTEEQQQQEEYQDQELLDDSGKSYTLHKNADGSETARYADGQDVTFRRQDDGSLSFMSGTAGLLAGLAGGYFLFHGLSSAGGMYSPSANAYVPSSTPSAISSSERASRIQRYAPAGVPIQDIRKDDVPAGAGSAGKGHSSSSSSVASHSSKSSSSVSSKSSVGSVKSGFGGAGARSSAS